MATMSYRDMAREAGLFNLALFRGRHERWGELIGKHGLDFQGLLGHLESNSSRPESDLKALLHYYRNDIANESLDATPDQIQQLVTNGLNVELLPKFTNTEPRHVVSASWPRLPFLGDGLEGMKQIMQRPEFQKAVLGDIGRFALFTVLPTMPNLSREDAEYIASKHPDATAVALAGGAPKEFIKAVIRNNEPKQNLFLGMKKDFVKVASEMMDDPSESHEVKRYLGKIALHHSVAGGGFGSYDTATEDDFKPLIRKMPVEDFKGLLEDFGAKATQDRVNRLVEGLGRNELPPELNHAADKWARKDPKKATIRFVNNGRGDELTQDELENVWNHYVDGVKNRPYEASLSRADKFEMARAIGSMPKETIDRLVEHNKGNSEILGTLGMWKYTNRYGEQPSDQQTQASTEKLPNFLRNKVLVDYLARQKGASTSFVTPEDLEKLAPFTGDEAMAMKLLVHPHATPKMIEDIFENDRADVFRGALDRVLDGFGNNQIVKDRDAYLTEGTHGTRTDVRVGSTALRHLREHLDDKWDNEGIASVRPEELPKGRTFNTLTRAVTDKKGNVQHVLDWNPLRDNRAGGNLTSGKVSEAIDAMPVMPIMVRPAGVLWTGAQNHKSGGTNVLQFMPPKEILQHFKDNGLYTAFGEMSLHHMPDGTNHPTAPFHLGWVRFNIDHKSKEIFIDEIQSDLHSSFRKLMKDPKNRLKSQMQSVIDTLFGKHHPSEVLHEAAHQYFRDKGYEGYKVHIHGLKSKAHMSLGDQTKEPPAHFKEGYEAVPKKMGYTPAKYGDLSIETGDGDFKAIGLKGMQTHGSKIVKFEELLFELAKGEW